MHPDLPDSPENPLCLPPLDQSVAWDPPVLLGVWVRKGNLERLDYQARSGHQDHKLPLAHLEYPERLDAQVMPAVLVLRERLEQWDLQDCLDFLADLLFLVHLVNPEVWDLLAPPDALV